MAPMVVWALLAAAVILAVVGMKHMRKDSPRQDDKRARANSLETKLTVQPCPMSAGGHWAGKEPPKIRLFKPVYHITMALQASSPADLIVMDRNYRDRVRERRRLIADHPAVVVGAIPRGAAAVQELYSYLMADYLPQRFPVVFEAEDHGKMVRNTATGAVFPVQPPDDPIRALSILGETVEDDLFLLHGEAQGHRSVAYVCCYPSGFNPAAKLDKLLVEIHEPVPSYHKIGPSMERFFSRVEVGKNVKRYNWSIVDSPTLFNNGSNHVKADDIGNVIEDEDIDIGKARMRVELQTLSRLPETRAVLFSFKTLLYTLDEIKSEGLGPQLADAIDGLGQGNAPGMWTYKGAVRWGKAAKEFLRS